MGKKKIIHQFIKLIGKKTALRKKINKASGS